ncbi:trifunctional serine/threonine-protein kinase/ATP-binding protein/sensor histidine kinase [Nostoc sp. 'Peltigera membranacea cyanobiont' N6]|uniref:trifunctional serine/threonine-protein kinase/ATP-binding protein/sensor histidine kinase n=1 Tax=Nostoc sp. 'Peltigera membranacea cyanobiont' N6 TaxID=1261031 RepID=UPI000CF34FA4|nr:AAA family ATPase [Nostoc sp. 'Peltigera membranacea cyanobiont' N6]AVH62120.1 multi-sensor signal transduction multi-kinase [Nostoc sp. 'Peltigera membranacea cyanobiont' N6]
MVSTFVSILGYRISEELYNGSRTLVYRGYRETDSLPVVIKLLKNPYPSFSELLQFRNQYTIAKNLNSPLIIQTYSLEPYQNGYALVMEDFGGISLKNYFTSNQTRYIASGEEFLEIAIALCNTLDILYRERIIHKDIKPANILINPETKQVKLIDFSIASLLPRETQTLINPNVLEGTLAYISPEQTGRMNRGIDYRTDFYSLGVTFYELLTGVLPFKSNDPMELVHSHIAKLPPLVHEINPQISSVVSEIVSKLMAKNAESRYQSALGLKFDLENCLHQLQSTGITKGFEIGKRDVCDRFIIPDKLYGREAEVETLLQTFERVSLGATEMMLVAGFSGIGKTAVVNEVHKPIVRQRGYFIKGKFDQFQRNIPFSAFVQAFRDLMEQLLTESDVQIQQWKNKILSAVGENGQVIIEVIPELSKIIGEQAPAIELSGTAAQNRFNLLFQKFTQVFTSAEHPLVMFLDDLQWADSASLKLIQLLMADTGHLLLIGAYRDNEVDPGHPLMLTLSEIQKNQATINTITLAPLSQLKVNQLVADTLKCPEDLALTLAQLVSQKTQGNPFFATQFLKALHHENLIKFDFDSGFWQCDIAQVTTLAVTDDVVAFMGFQLRKLPQSTQDILQLAACIGNQFDLGTLAIVSQQSQIETAADLWKALQEGLILPISDVYKFYVGQENQVFTQDNQQTVTYKFLHDRVQQAAYSLIPDQQKQATHLKIGQLLLNNAPVTEQKENLFEIVNQLNIGKSLIFEPEAQIELAQLNLNAGEKARDATAYNAALEYATTGIALLNSLTWQTHYNFTLALHELATETAYMSVNFEQIEKWADIVLQQAKTAVDKMKVYAVKVQGYMAQVKKLEAVNIGLEALELVGVSLPKSPQPSDIQQAITQTVSNLQGKKIEDLINLPLMTDVEKLAATKMLASMFTPAYQAAPALLPLVTCELMNLSINYGNSPFSTPGYVFYGMLLNSVFQEIESGYQFGKLAINLAEQFNFIEIKSHIFNLVGTFSIHGKAHIRETLPILWDSYESGVECGNFEHAGISAMMIYEYAYFMGQELTALAREMAFGSDALARIKQENALGWHQITQELVLNLLNPSGNPCSLRGEIYNEETRLPLMKQVNDRSGVSYLYLNKLILCYLLGEYQQAQENSLESEQYLDGLQGTMSVPVFHFYDSLTHLAIYPSVPDSQQKDILSRVTQNQEKMKLWADHAPMNFQHKFDLVAAEQFRILGNKTEAIEYYDRAISGAQEQGYIQEEALANELAAKFYLHWGKKRIAQEYMTQAYYGYVHWGAKAKVTDLEKRYPQLLTPILEQTRSPFSTHETIFALGSTSTTSATSSSASSVSVALDLAAILKASQTISGEIELEKLLSSLLEIVIENAGADKCVLMLLGDSCLLIKGSITVGTEPVVLQSLPVEDSQDIPLKLIYKVKNNRQTVVLIDATANPTLANDSYIMRQQPKSILCSPILHQGKLLGVLYLENNLATGAFTSDRVELLNLLCTQAAISLENARLYERSQTYSQQLEQALREQQKLAGVVQNSSDFIGITTLTGQTIYLNPAGRQLIGLDDDAEISNFQIRDFHSPEDFDQIEREILPRVMQQGVGHGEMNFRHFQTGQLIPTDYVLFVIKDPLTNQPLCLASISRDIRDRKKAEAAIIHKSQQLEQALGDLQQTQLQMIQSEKMSALGNLVAGVAHEMNNPLGFIAASLIQAKPTFTDIVEHLGLYQESLPNKSDKILDHAEEIDLDYSLEDLPKMIDSMSMACDRLKNISTSLRTFSRADQDYKVPFNIHQGIDSTILILKHRLKPNEQRPAIEVVTNYGNLPQVECFPGQLNQVFMNLLANAIDALDESNTGRSFEEIKGNPNCITITTSVENHLVKIGIADNGKGMNEQVKSKIFDHLFTTKAVGKGTGLGLAIARQIVESTHGGKLSCNSVLGEGTEFMIEIPV